MYENFTLRLFPDLLVEFIMSHMMKRLPVELYRQCIGIIHRLLCYQKKCTVRINYNWKVLWEALITLLKFLIVYENHASKEVDVFSLTSQVSRYSFNFNCFKSQLKLRREITSVETVTNSLCSKILIQVTLLSIYSGLQKFWISSSMLF